MGTYKDHPFHSDAGQAIMLDIFKGIYRTDDNDATQIYSDVSNNYQQKNMVSHYMKNKVGIVFNIRKFLSSYTPVNPNDSFDSGIYICDPSQGGCGRRDFIYNWEFVDFGIYGNMKTWRGNVDLVKNTLNGQRGYMVMTRARCNAFVVCLDCGEQWATDSTGASVCIYCNSSNVKMGGCSKEVYSKHFVKEQNVRNLQAENQLAIEDPTAVNVIQTKGKSAIINHGKPFAYRLVYRGPAKDRQINTFDEACDYIPTLEVGYEIGKFRKPYGFECNVCQHERFFPPPNSREPFGASMVESNVDKNWTSNQHTPQTGGVYSPIGKNGTQNCTEDGCTGFYEPMLGWNIGKPKLLGPMDQYSDDYKSNNNMMQQQIARAYNALPAQYPISALRHAFTMDPKIVCTAHKTNTSGLDRAPVLWSDRPISQCLKCGYTQEGYDMTGQQCSGTDANNWSCVNAGSAWKLTPPGRKLDMCPQCGTNSDPVNYKTFESVSGRPFLFPRKKLIISAKHDGGFLTMANVTGRPIRNRPCWQIFLDSGGGDDYRFGLSLAGIHTSSMVPTSINQIQTQPISGGSGLGITCKYDPIMDPNGTTQTASNPTAPPPPQGCCALPNGTSIVTTENICIAQTGTYLGDGVDCLTAKIAGATGTGPCSGVTWSGLTFMIAEGRSQHAFKNSKNRWVDQSVPCRSYRDPKAPDTPLQRPITIPRFIYGPTYDPRVKAGTLKTGRRYEWCDPKGHVICDPFHLGSLASVSTTAGGQIGITTHDITQVGVVDDPVNGKVVLIKCKTCEKIYKKGLNLVMSKSPAKGTPFPSSDWTLIGGGKDLQHAYENGLYYPGMAVLMFRKGKGQIKVNGDLKDIANSIQNLVAIDTSGWKLPDGTRDAARIKAHYATFPILTPKPRQYSIECFQAELKTEQEGQGPLIPGYWNWMHVDASEEGSHKANNAKGTVAIL